MIIEEMRLRNPDLPYFADPLPQEFPAESPVSMTDLDELYPAASARAKEDSDVMQAARVATVALQQGHRGYRALWKHFVTVSIADLRHDYGALGVSFDRWLGESDAHGTVVTLLEKLTEQGLARVSDGALVVPVARTTDSKELPPLLLRNSEGAELYGATDIATLYNRVSEGVF